MKPRPFLIAVVSLLSALLSTAADQPQKIPPSWRNIETGWAIPDESYADQPYIVKCDDGAWLCVITTAAGKEGDHSQHIVGTRSTDFGRTWSPLIKIEPPGPPEASYVTALKVLSGRIYVFYNYNGDRLKEVKKIDGGTTTRVDTLGHFVFKYSDDHGKTWSVERYQGGRRFIPALKGQVFAPSAEINMNDSISPTRLEPIIQRPRVAPVQEMLYTDLRKGERVQEWASTTSKIFRELNEHLDQVYNEWPNSWSFSPPCVEKTRRNFSSCFVSRDHYSRRERAMASAPVLRRSRGYAGAA